MISIDTVIDSLPVMPESKRAIWMTNATRVIARGPRRNPAYSSALRLRDSIAAFEATRPANSDLIAAFGLDWDRMVKDRTSFRGFDGAHLVARVTRIKPNKFVVQVQGVALSQPYTTLSAARAAASKALLAGAHDAPAPQSLAA
jgi:hypothetical protein